MHEERQGSVVTTVCRDVQSSYRRTSGRVPKVDAVRRSSTHFCRDGLCPVRVPADGEVVHAAHHHQDVQHP